MSQAAAALRAAAAALLTAQGERALAALVEGAELSVQAPETWSMGARTVSAHRLSLAVDAPELVALRADPGRLELVRSAFETAVRSPDSELADLALLLRLPAVGTSWQRAYRDAPPHETAERPTPEAVLAGAGALLAAADARSAAQILARASLEVADLPATGSEPLVRYVVRLDPADLAEAQRAAELADKLRRAVHDAALRADERIASVELAAALIECSAGSPDGPEGLLRRALATRDVTSFTVERQGGTVVVAMVVEGELRLVRIDARAHGVRRSHARIPSFDVGADALQSDEAAHEVAAELCEPE
jgi:hypothetical protein